MSDPDKKPIAKLRIALSYGGDPTAEGQSLESAVDEDIAAFEEYFCGELKNDSLSKPERSIIKTYLWWKTHQERTRG